MPRGLRYGCLLLTLDFEIEFPSSLIQSRYDPCPSCPWLYCAVVVLDEMNAMFRDKVEFSRERFVLALRKLSKMPRD